MNSKNFNKIKKVDEIFSSKGIGKKLSLITKFITFIISIIIYCYVVYFNKKIPSKEASISIIIFMLGCSSVMYGVDLSLIIRNIKGDSNNKDSNK